MADVLIILVFPALLIVAAVSDIWTMKISNWISIALIAGFALVALLTGMPIEKLGLHLAAGGLLLTAGFILFCFKLIGGGDAKLLAAIGLWFGLDALFPFLVVTAFLGGPLCLVLLFLRNVPLPSWLEKQEWAKRLHSKSSGVPYGVAIAAAGLLLYAETPLMRGFAA